MIAARLQPRGDDDGDVFEDAKSEEGELTPQTKQESLIEQVDKQPKGGVNQLEVQLQISGATGAIELNCVLSDIRFVFAVPTAQKLALVGLSLQEALADAELDKKAQRTLAYQVYRTVFASLEAQDGAAEQQMMRKVYLNLAQSCGVPVEAALKVLADALTKLEQGS